MLTPRPPLPPPQGRRALLQEILDLPLIIYYKCFANEHSYGTTRRQCRKDLDLKPTRLTGAVSFGFPSQNKEIWIVYHLELELIFFLFCLFDNVIKLYIKKNFSFGIKSE